ncbi:MAG TPA: efflux RND transporter periplasmic adaptor subunit, partial [Xanthobacteraceae bacterium]|nr:efflux RND transporter periplasmic adaptor subunit [Xanthobacteraceae bacterium]
VSVAIATRQSVPIYLTGLGTVQASSSIDIRSKVDGELQVVLFTEGQRVKKGDDLAKIDPRLFQAALDQAKAKKAQDEAVLIAVEKDLVRAEALILKNIETQQNVDQQRSKVDQTKALIAADAAAIESAQTQLDYTNIKAPSDGRIGIRLVDPGNMVHASDIKPLANLVLTQPSAVIFTLPAADVDEVRKALRRGPVEVTAFDPDNKVAQSTGTLLLIDNAIDPTTATIRLKAMFANTDDVLWPGEFVNARVLVETRHDAITVPNAAIQSGPQGLFAWVVASDDTVQPRPTEVGPTAGDSTVVAAGLSDGDRVVVAGQYKLQPKTKVVISGAAPAASEPIAAK